MLVFLLSDKSMKIIKPERSPSFLNYFLGCKYSKFWDAHENLFQKRCDRVMEMIKRSGKKPDNERIKWIKHAEEAFIAAANMKSLRDVEVLKYLYNNHDVLRVYKAESILHDYGTFKLLWKS